MLGNGDVVAVVGIGAGAGDVADGVGADVGVDVGDLLVRAAVGECELRTGAELEVVDGGGVPGVKKIVSEQDSLVPGLSTGCGAVGGRFQVSFVHRTTPRILSLAGMTLR
jgi:hypothetical protein